MNKDTIYHHGILGMRWGRRNGPPYPLSPGDHSASEKKAGWRKSLRLTDTQKRALKIAGTTAIVGASIYGAYKISQLNGNFLPTINIGKDFVKNVNVNKTKINRIIDKTNIDNINKGTEYAKNLLANNQKMLNNASSSIKNGMYNPNLKGNDWFDQFRMKRVQRVSSDGKISTIDIPEDIEFYKDKYAEWANSQNGKGYDYWYDRITKSFANLGIR